MIPKISRLATMTCLLLAGASCGSPDEDAVAEPSSRGPVVESKWLEQPQESLKGDVVVYEIDGEVAIRLEFVSAFNQLNVSRTPARESSSTMQRDCSFVRGKIQDGKPLDPSCEGDTPLTDIPTFTTEHNATHKVTGQKYMYEWKRTRIPGRHILRHRIKKLP